MSTHSDLIARMRRNAKDTLLWERQLDLELAADLLELHDSTGISLDNWKTARTFVEYYAGAPIEENLA